MGEILRPPNGNALMLTPRSGSHSLAAAALQQFWPEAHSDWLAAGLDAGHPATYFPSHEQYAGQADLGLVVRDPVERFRSMCAHRPARTIEDHLAQPVYGPLPQGNFVRYFRFEELDAVADYLGLPTPLPQIDATDEADKPTLTPEQEARVREIYADDIALWGSLTTR